MKRKIEIYLVTSVILFFFQNTQSQNVITGTVSSLYGDPIENISVSLKKLESKVTVSYSYTDNLGKYVIKTEKKGPFKLVFSSLNFANKEVEILLTEEDSKQIHNVDLQSDIYLLSEVAIKTKKSIKIKKDTIIFNAASFTDGTETVAEDLLRKIPGINVSDDGTIKVGNQEVEKIMIENDDFFEKGYKTLTKNLPANPIDKVEILKRYSNNKLLKGIEESDKIAINLTLKDDAKRQWFGNFDVGYGLASENRYDARANFLNFGKKNKYYFFTNFNNVGYDATGDFSSLIRSSRFEEPGGIGDNELGSSFVNLSNSVPFFKKSRTTFNNSELLSLNAIFNPTTQLKIKPIFFANWDELAFLRNRSDTFIANQTNFTNTEDYTLDTNYIQLFGKLDVTYNLSKTATLESTTRYSNSDFNKSSRLVFNDDLISQQLNENNIRVDQKIGYSNKLTETKAFLITGRYLQEGTPQNFQVSQNNFTPLFTNTTANDPIQQQSNLSYTYLGLEAHLLDRKDSGHLWEVKAGHTYREDDVLNNFSIEGSQANTVPQGFQNDLTYSVSDTYIWTKYLYKFSDQWSIKGTIAAHHIGNQFKSAIDENNEQQNVFIVNPALSTAFELNDNNKFTLGSSLSRRNVDVLDIYDGFALNSFRSFSKGTGTFNQLDAFSSNFSYTLGNWSDRFFGSAFVTYLKTFDFLASSNTIEQDFSLSEKVLFKDRDLFSASVTIDNYINFIKSNIKGKLSYATVNFKNIVNNSPVREITSENITYGTELRSGFNGIFNYHLGTEWTLSGIQTQGFSNSFTNNKSFLDLSLIFTKQFNIQLQTERYHFGNFNTDNTYYFADLQIRYDIIPNEISLSLSGKNLFNTEVFREFSISDLGASTTEYRLLPRYLLLEMTYRF